MNDDLLQTPGSDRESNRDVARGRSQRADRRSFHNPVAHASFSPCRGCCALTARIPPVSVAARMWTRQPTAIQRLKRTDRTGPEARAAASAHRPCARAAVSNLERRALPATWRRLVALTGVVAVGCAQQPSGQRAAQPGVMTRFLAPTLACDPDGHVYVASAEQAKALVDRLGDSVRFYKVGLELFMAGGVFEVIDWLTVRGKRVFAAL